MKYKSALKSFHNMFDFDHVLINRVGEYTKPVFWVGLRGFAVAVQLRHFMVGLRGSVIEILGCVIRLRGSAVRFRGLYISFNV